MKLQSSENFSGYGAAQLASAVKSFCIGGDDFSLVKALVYAAALLAVRKNWSSARVEEKKVALKAMYVKTVHCIGRVATVAQFAPLLTPARDGINEAVDVSTLAYGAVDLVHCQCIAGLGMSTALHTVTLAHLYTMARLDGYPAIGILESVCDNFANNLFLDGRPQSYDELDNSCDNWLNPRASSEEDAAMKRVQEILSIRNKRLTLIYQVVGSNFCINRDIRERLGVENHVKSSAQLMACLLSGLRREMDAHHELAKVCMAAKGVVEEIGRRNQMNADTATALVMLAVRRDKQKVKEYIDTFVAAM